MTRSAELDQYASGGCKSAKMRFSGGECWGEISSCDISTSVTMMSSAGGGSINAWSTSVPGCVRLFLINTRTRCCSYHSQDVVNSSLPAPKMVSSSSGKSQGLSSEIFFSSFLQFNISGLEQQSRDTSRIWKFMAGSTPGLPSSTNPPPSYWWLESLTRLMVEWRCLMCLEMCPGKYSSLIGWHIKYSSLIGS